jgi:transcriptional regulator with XRE-family HTH domain
MASDVDKQWFMERWAEKRFSLRDMARKMDIDPSALSRTLSGGRQMKPQEIVNIATILGVTSEEVLAHLGAADTSDETTGFAESPQAEFEKPVRRHPLFGRLKGVITLAPGVDLTEPPDPDLADYLDRKYGPEVRD